MKPTRIPVLALVLLLAACSTQSPEVQEAVDDLLDSMDSSADSMMNDDSMMMDDDDSMMMDDDDSMMMDDDDAMMESEAQYITYNASVLANGEQKILFFHAAWCPTCRDADNKLTQWYSQEDPTLSVYKVDYDSNTELRSKYGVTYQHTFVLVDGQGNEIRSVSGPTDAVLMQLIGV